MSNKEFENMEKIIFKNCLELGAFMYNKAKNGYYTVAVLFYNEAKQLLKKLLQYDNTDISLIEINSIEYNGYEKEYYVSIADDMVVSVEPAYKNGIYLNAEADLTLVDNNASSKIICNADHKKCRELYVGCKPEEDSCDCCKYDFLYNNMEFIEDEFGNIIEIHIQL